MRKALYLAALSAIRRRESKGRFYQRLRRRGKPGKVALVAVMRLLMQLHAVAAGQSWLEDYGHPTSSFRRRPESRGGIGGRHQFSYLSVPAATGAGDSYGTLPRLD